MQYDNTSNAHKMARELVIEVIRARGNLITGNVPNTDDGKRTAAFIGALFDDLVQHFDGQK